MHNFVLSLKIYNILKIYQIQIRTKSNKSKFCRNSERREDSSKNDVVCSKLPFHIPTGGKTYEEEYTNGFDTGSLIEEGWREKHASQSEAIVKAERNKNGSDIIELQRKSVSYIHNFYKCTKTRK